MKKLVQFFDYDFSSCSFRFFQLTPENPSVTIMSGGPTEEGYSRSTQTWSLDVECGCVRYSCDSTSRDCDGRHEDYSDFTCDFDKLAALESEQDGQPLPFKLPAWTCTTKTQRDHTAEAAGY